MKQRQPLIHLPAYGNGDFETVAAFIFLFCCARTLTSSPEIIVPFGERKGYTYSGSEVQICDLPKGCPPSPQVFKKTTAFLYTFGTGEKTAKQPKNTSKVFRIFERPFTEQLAQECIPSNRRVGIPIQRKSCPMHPPEDA